MQYLISYKDVLLLCRSYKSEYVSCIFPIEMSLKDLKEKRGDKRLIEHFNFFGEINLYCLVCSKVIRLFYVLLRTNCADKLEMKL